MSIFDIIKYLAAAVSLLICLYTVARVITAAFFRSKQDYERTGSNGTQKQP